MARIFFAALALVSMAAVADAGTPKRHVANPPTAVVSVFGFKFLMNRPNCEIRKNGPAWLDACAPDSMAAATGDSRRKGKNK